jgi:hypothetical protein
MKRHHTGPLRSEVLDCCNTTTGADPCWGCKGGAPVYAYLSGPAGGG